MDICYNTTNNFYYYVTLDYIFKKRKGPQMRSLSWLQEL